MNKQLSILILLSMGIIVACGPSMQKRSQKIAEMEKALVDPGTGMINKPKAKALIAEYESFVKDFPKDTISPAYLLKGAEIQLQAATPQEAIATLDRIMNNYPEFRKVAHCLFLKGFIYENNLGDLENAKSCYLEFLRKYPRDDFADDAQAMLNNLGKSPDELIREFEAKAEAKKAETGAH
ncbi:MAG: tetratricopeptide repeat protein [Bacteroidetes bacterium]|nr:tetratricopeptide repeat protein [Bacteroidota bacterium]